MMFVLSQRPNEWAKHPDGFYQRWMPGAFGDMDLLPAELGFRVLEDEWAVVNEGVDDERIERTILRAEVVTAPVGSQEGSQQAE